MASANGRSRSSASSGCIGQRLFRPPKEIIENVSPAGQSQNSRGAKRTRSGFCRPPRARSAIDPCCRPSSGRSQAARAQGRPGLTRSGGHRQMTKHRQGSPQGQPRGCARNMAPRPALRPDRHRRTVASNPPDTGGAGGAGFQTLAKAVSRPFCTPVPQPGPHNGGGRAEPGCRQRGRGRGRAANRPLAQVDPAPNATSRDGAHEPSTSSTTRSTGVVRPGLVPAESRGAGPVGRKGPEAATRGAAGSRGDRLGAIEHSRAQAADGRARSSVSSPRKPRRGSPGRRRDAQLGRKSRSMSSARGDTPQEPRARLGDALGKSNGRRSAQVGPGNPARVAVVGVARRNRPRSGVSASGS